MEDLQLAKKDMTSDQHARKRLSCTKHKALQASSTPNCEEAGTAATNTTTTWKCAGSRAKAGEP